MTSTLIDPDLVNEVLALKQGNHLCLIYENDPTEQLPVLLPFIRQGLENGEQCVYIADDHTVEDLRDALTAYGIDVSAQVEKRALLLWTRKEWRQPGELDSAKKAEQVAGIVEAALASGFTGVLFGVEMTWTLGPDIDVERLRHWEATINTIFTPELPVRIICLYNRGRLTPATIHAALSTHPVAVLGHEICANPFYEAPLVLDGNSVYTAAAFEPTRIDWMLSQLRWIRALEKEREQRIRAEATSESLRQAITVKDQFLGLVSHELKTPLTTVLGNARILQSRGKVLREEDRQQAWSDLLSEGEKLQRIIENLLLLARMEAPNFLEIKPVSVPQLLSGCIKAFERRKPDRKISFISAENVPPALAEPVLLSEVVENLLSNADKYSPSDTTIEISLLSNNEGDPEVCIRDYGCGIEAAELEKVFETFYRSPKSRNSAEGLGLGLAVCQRLIEAQGGRIWAETRAEGGCDFIFSVPAAKVPEAAAKRPELEV